MTTQQNQDTPVSAQMSGASQETTIPGKKKEVEPVPFCPGSQYGEIVKAVPHMMATNNHRLYM